MDDRQRLNSLLLFPKSETIWRALDLRVEEEAAAHITDWSGGATQAIKDVHKRLYF